MHCIVGTYPFESPPWRVFGSNFLRSGTINTHEQSRAYGDHYIGRWW